MASEGLMRCVYEGCIAGQDMEIERRPYHRNCSCALHKLRGCIKGSPCNAKISYPVRRSWSESCLVMHGTSSSPSSSPVSTMERNHHQHQSALHKKEENVSWEI